MLKLLGSLCVAAGGALAWHFQRTERERKRKTREDFRTVFRRMGEGIRMARTPLPVLLRTLSADCGPDAAAFFASVSEDAVSGEDLARSWRARARELALDERDKAIISALGEDLKGDEEKVCKGISHAVQALSERTVEAEQRRAEEEKRAAALWFSAAALLVILLV